MMARVLNESGPDAGAAWHYGDPLREQRRLEAGEATVDLSHRPVFTVAGPDRLTWLHALTSQAFEGLLPGQHVTAFILDPNGRIEHVFGGVDDGETFWAHTEPGHLEALLAWLSRMVFASRVELADRSATHAMVIAGEPDGTLTNGHYRWTAADLFHRGATDARTGRVRLDPLRVAQGLALYGPCLPVAPGRYRGTLVTEPVRPSDAGADVGHLLVVTMGDPDRRLTAVPVTAGRPAACEFDVDGTRPLRLEFHYHRRQPVRLVALELERLSPAP